MEQFKEYVFNDSTQIPWYKLDNCEYIVISGGSTRGVALCSSWVTLCQIYKYKYPNKKLFDKIKGCAGTSIGSCIALCILCGMDNKTMKYMCYNEAMEGAKEFESQMDYLGSIEKGYLVSNKYLYEMIFRMMNLLHLSLDITFEGLYEKTNKMFICNSFCESDQKMFYMSIKTTPKMKIVDALCASMAVPILFSPFIENTTNLKYVDGGIYENYMIDQFPEENTLGIKLDIISKEDNEIPKNIFMVFSKLLYSMANRIDDLLVKKFSNIQLENTITIPLPELSRIKMSMTKEQCDYMWKNGKKYTLWFFFGKRFLSSLIESIIKESLDNQKDLQEEKEEEI